MVSGPSPTSTSQTLDYEPGNISGGKTDFTLASSAEKQEPVEPSLNLHALTEDVHQKLNMIHKADLKFSVHEGSGRMFVSVVDADTGEVIREIPPSEMLDLEARLDQMIGLLFNQVG